MELIYSDHAVIRMEQRRITHSIVLDICLNPDGKIKQSMDKEILYKKIKNRSDNLIAVILISKNEVVTVMNYFEVRM